VIAQMQEMYPEQAAGFTAELGKFFILSQVLHF
jgi:hypothetical protein